MQGSLASLVPELVGHDDTWRLRLLLHEFGLRWAGAERAERVALVAEEPTTTGDGRWDAFLGAYAEHLAFHAGFTPPAWALAPGRYLTGYWFAGGADLATLRVEAIVHAPAAFEAHGVLLARRELDVV